MAYSKREAPNCDWCPQRKRCFYELLGTKESKKTWKDIRLAHPFRAGEVIFHEGTLPQGVFVVCTGKVKVYKSSRTGQQLTTRIEHAGDLVGHITLLSKEGPYTSTAEALEPATVSMIDERAFIDFLGKYPQSSLALMREMAKDVRRGENKARDIAFKPARGRLADVLVRMMTPGKPVPRVAGIKRRDMAEMAALTIETCVRLLKDFEVRGLIKKKDKDLLIVNESQLRALASVSA